MTDHYIAFLEEQAQLLKRHLKAARAQRDDALTEAAIFGLVNALIKPLFVYDVVISCLNNLSTPTER